MKDNFLLKKNQREVFDTLTDEEAGKLIKGIFRYLDTNDSGLVGALQAIFIPIRDEINKNEEKYKKKCEILKRNRNQSDISMKSERNHDDIRSDNNHISYIINHLEEKDIEKGVIGGKEEEKETFNGTAKASKHKYGEFKNVLLKDEELQALKENYSNYQELIEHLSEYIERKGYKANSHYLCIKKWVVDAVKEENRKKKKVNDEDILQRFETANNAGITPLSEEEQKEVERLINGMSK